MNQLKNRIKTINSKMRYLLPIIAFLLIWNFSCKPTDNFDTSSDVMLEFSLDTLRFDTVFTELGSATRILKVYNRNDKDIKISKIRIKNDPNTFFRINVDGIAGNEISDVEIAGNDSLYIFGEVTIDPDQPLSNSPFVIEDYLVFETNGNTQEVLMEAWGQNAIYYPTRFEKAQQNIVDCTTGGGTFTITNEKPWVFYGTLGFFECDVIVEEGARIHVHGGLVAGVDQDDMRFFYNDGRIVFLQGSSLTVNGTQENPVIISGDRLEEPFADISGQWFGLLFLNGSDNHDINHMEIKNSIVGVFVDSLVNMDIESSKIFNTSNAGLIARHATVKATNCLFYNNGSNAVRFFEGGDYDFTYCTLASYGVDASALSMSNLNCGNEDPLGCSPCFENVLNATFKNSIIFGSKRDEISMTDGDECDPGVSSPMNYFFENCIVRVDELTEQMGFENFFNFCNPCQNGDNEDVIFFDPNEDDYHLDTLSLAEERAEAISIDIDLDGFIRDNTKPDLGCYEYQY